MLDTKLKSNRKVRKGIIVAALVFCGLANTLLFCCIQKSIDTVKLNDDQSDELVYSEEAIGNIYEANHVLYCSTLAKLFGDSKFSFAQAFAVEQNQNSDENPDYVVENSEAQNSLETSNTEEETDIGQENVAIDADENEESSYYDPDSLYAEMNTIERVWEAEAERILNNFDYLVQYQDTQAKQPIELTNTTFDLQPLAEGKLDKEQVEKLRELYSFYAVMNYDQYGIMTMDTLWQSGDENSEFLKLFQSIDRNCTTFAETTSNYGFGYKGISNVRFVYALPKNSNFTLTYNTGTDWYVIQSIYKQYGGFYEMLATIAYLVLLAFFTNSQKIWGEAVTREPERYAPFFIKYPLELATFILLCTAGLVEWFYELLYDSDVWGLVKLLVDRQYHSITSPHVFSVVLAIAVVILLCTMFYWAVCKWIPVFRMGFFCFLRENSVMFHFIPWVRRRFNDFYVKLRHIDLREKGTKIIFRTVIVNLIFLCICCLLGVFGIPLLLCYGVFQFIWIRRYYKDIRKDFEVLLQATKKIEQGEQDVLISQDVGVFEPMKEQIEKLQEGLKEAVEQEVQSQRMKTELITNVSHDLKTPLTAITTYVELLKNENITPEQQKEYIATLEKKSYRLKVLIDDLFEVSKANTNNIKLDLLEVDLVKLIRQVGVEFEEKMKEQGLSVKYAMPSTPTLLLLDGQKTYRIISNLYTNIIKYAMPNSRVYVDVVDEGKDMKVTIRNISATELNFRAEEITERFVRGDLSRNTEGSGLGLAIAKSLTEAQHGSFCIEADCDTFKAIIKFQKNIEETK